MTVVAFELSSEEMEAVEDFRAFLDLPSPASALRLLVRIGLHECHDPMADDDPDDAKLH